MQLIRCGVDQHTVKGPFHIIIYESSFTSRPLVELDFSKAQTAFDWLLLQQTTLAPSHPNASADIYGLDGRTLKSFGLLDIPGVDGIAEAINRGVTQY